MCLAVPGKITKIKNGMATVDYGSEKRQASTSLKECKIGDWVIVSAKFVMQIIPEDEAKKVLAVWDETDRV